jgi:hypothetical protein
VPSWRNRDAHAHRTEPRILAALLACRTSTVFASLVGTRATSATFQDNFRTEAKTFLALPNILRRSSSIPEVSMSTTSKIASHGRKAGVHEVRGFWIMLAIIALFGLALCAVISSIHVIDDLGQAQLIGP